LRLLQSRDQKTCPPLSWFTAAIFFSFLSIYPLSLLDPLRALGAFLCVPSAIAFAYRAWTSRARRVWLEVLGWIVLDSVIWLFWGHLSYSTWASGWCGDGLEYNRADLHCLSGRHFYEVMGSENYNDVGWPLFLVIRALYFLMLASIAIVIVHYARKRILAFSQRGLLTLSIVTALLGLPWSIYNEMLILGGNCRFDVGWIACAAYLAALCGLYERRVLRMTYSIAIGEELVATAFRGLQVDPERIVREPVARTRTLRELWGQSALVACLFVATTAQGACSVTWSVRQKAGSCRCIESRNGKWIWLQELDRAPDPSTTEMPKCVQ
jgi:hypothetical protein